MLSLARLAREVGFLGKKALYHTPSFGVWNTPTQALYNYQSLIRTGLCAHGKIESAPEKVQQYILTILSTNSGYALFREEKCNIEQLLNCDDSTLKLYTAHIVHHYSKNVPPLDLNQFKSLKRPEQQALTGDKEPNILDTFAAASCGK